MGHIAAKPMTTANAWMRDAGMKNFPYSRMTHNAMRNYTHGKYLTPAIIRICTPHTFAPANGSQATQQCAAIVIKREAGVNPALSP
jgi:hypothetical protein